MASGSASSGKALNSVDRDNSQAKTNYTSNYKSTSSKDKTIDHTSNISIESPNIVGRKSNSSKDTKDLKLKKTSS